MFTSSFTKANVKVISVYCDEDKVRSAAPGENVRVKLSGIEEEDIAAGFVLSNVGKFIFFFQTYKQIGKIIFHAFPWMKSALYLCRLVTNSFCYCAFWHDELLFCYY